jgi:hypothetical protein
MSRPDLDTGEFLRGHSGLGVNVTTHTHPVVNIAHRFLVKKLVFEKQTGKTRIGVI